MQETQAAQRSQTRLINRLRLERLSRLLPFLFYSSRRGLS